MTDVRYIERDYPSVFNGEYYDKDWCKVQVNSYDKSHESQFFTDVGTTSTGVVTNWKAWNGYTSADVKNKKAFTVEMKFNVPKAGRYRIECYYSTKGGYYVTADTYLDGELVTPYSGWGTFGQIPKRHFDKVDIKKTGIHTLKFNMSFNAIWLATIIKHEVLYEADTENKEVLTLLNATFKKAEMINVDELSFNLLYDNRYKDTLPINDPNRNPSGLKFDYRDEVNFYVKTHDGTIKQIYGGYIHSIVPDEEKMTVAITCGNRITDLDKQFTLTEMSLLGGDEDYNGEYEYGNTLIDVTSYTRAIEVLCNMCEETLQTNLPAGSLTLPGESFEDGFRKDYQEKIRDESKDHYNFNNMESKWLSQGLYLRNKPNAKMWQSATLWDSAMYPEIEKNGLDLSEYPVFYIGYEMLEPKWEEETTTSSGDSSKIWDDASQFEYNAISNTCSTHDPKSARTGMEKYGRGDCFGMTSYLYYRFNFEAGIPARDVKTLGHGNSKTHHIIQLYIDGQWTFPKEGYAKLQSGFGLNSSSINNSGTCIARAEPSKKGDINTMPGYNECSFYGKHEAGTI